MIPVMVDPRAVRVAVVGQGPAFARRIQQLIDGGAEDLLVFSLAPEASFRDAPGVKLVDRLPNGDDFAGVSLVYIAGLESDRAAPLVEAAREQSALVNVEDVIALCDFHVPSVVRRGDLLITVSTGGKSPGLARRLRKDLEAGFGVEWEARLGALADARRGWLDEGLDLAAVASRTNTMIDEHGWLA